MLYIRKYQILYPPTLCLPSVYISLCSRWVLLTLSTPLFLIPNVQLLAQTALPFVNLNFLKLKIIELWNRSIDFDSDRLRESGQVSSDHLLIYLFVYFLFFWCHIWQFLVVTWHSEITPSGLREPYGISWFELGVGCIYCTIDHSNPISLFFCMFDK